MLLATMYWGRTMNKRKWNERKLSDIATLIDYRGKTPQKSSRGIPLITAKIVKNGTILPANEFIAESQYASWMTRGYPCVGDVVMTTEAPLGEVAQLRDAHVALAQRIITIRGKNDVLDNGYLKYFLQSAEGQGRLRARETGTTVTGIKAAELRELMIPLPDIVQQRKISKVLLDLDEKIYNLTQINHNLEEQAKALYDQIWDNYANDTWSSAKAEDLFDISIGKTPPRKETQWFSENNNDIVWVSIADMGQSGCFISNSSEYLTPDAVSRFNVKRVPAGAILLSFKLTVGRVAITGCELTTNEAIAHFRIEDSTIREYLYFYLKQFNYQTMGSTSSIATAVNSKMVKAMRIDIPSRETLERFHSTVASMFEKIKQNQQEIEKLAQLRDALLPKLMSGEIDVSEVEI